MKINITYATILGTSQMLAEDLEEALSGAHEVSVTDIMHLAISARDVSDRVGGEACQRYIFTDRVRA